MYLRLTAIEHAYTSPGYLQVKVVVAQVTTSVSNLNDHLLAADRSGSESELVTTAAPSGFGKSANAGGGETVREIIVNSPGLIVIAHVAAATVASALYE